MKIQHLITVSLPRSTSHSVSQLIFFLLSEIRSTISANNVQHSYAACAACALQMKKSSTAKSWNFTAHQFFCKARISVNCTNFIVKLEIFLIIFIIITLILAILDSSTCALPKILVVALKELDSILKLKRTALAAFSALQYVL